MLQVSINGQSHTFEDDLTILQALQQINVEVPTLCHDERLTPYGGCRLCIVNVEGAPRPVTACNTPLSADMVITTHTPEIETQRRTLLRLLAQQYPAAAVEQFPEKEFHRYIRDYGLQNELAGTTDPNLQDVAHPYIHVDMSQCVYCFRCVRICEEVQGQFTWQVWERGDETRIRPDSGTTLFESSCVSCGACVDTCPSGALEDKSLLALPVAEHPTSWTKTTCPYCGTGCEMLVGTREHRIISVKPALDAPVSKGHLCSKGRYAIGFVHADDRITEPMIRRDGQWQTVSWQEATTHTARELERILEQEGPKGVGVLGSARATNEENYLAQKFARVVLGTNNVDCCARVCHTPTAAAMKMMLGTGAATNSYEDIEAARTFLICGSNPTENHPIIGARIKQQALKGAHLIVIDPRQTEFTEYGAIHLALRPGTNVPLLNALAHVIVTEGLYAADFIAERITEWEEFKAFIADYAPEKITEICGVDPKKIRRAARLYAQQKPAMSFHGLGLTEHVQGTEGVMCLVNLALLTGNIGRPGTGINPLRGQNNVQGAAHMGCDRGILTGAVPIKDHRERFEKIWQASIPTEKGLHLMEMLDAAAEAKLKALWVIGYDLLLSAANTQATRKSFENLELVIIQDMFMTETAKEFGTVFLPAASSFEKEGTFMNAERRIQKIRPAIDPPDAVLSDWQVICELARAMGKGKFFAYENAEAIWNEIRSVWPAAQGMTYERLEQQGLQWPCPSENHPGTQILHQETFSHAKTTPLRRIPYTPTSEVTNGEFPYLLTTGRNLFQFNAGTMTSRTPSNELRPTDLLDVSPPDAKEIGLSDGDLVRICSRYGEATLPVRIDPGMKSGEVFASFHTAEAFLNRVTSTERDHYVQTPEYKVTAVRLTPLGAARS